MAGVPDDRVVWGVEHAVQRERELDRAEVRAEVSAVRRDRLHDQVADLVGELVELGRVEATEVGGTGDGVEDGHDRAAQRVDAAARSDSRSESVVAITAVGS